ncbi:MAG: ankyrin repeat domain-containing protein, partial [Pseudomonadota bacterium]
MKRLALCISLTTMLLASNAGAASLLESTRANDSKAALAFVAQGADVNAAESNGTTVLQWAVHNGDVALVEKLLKAGADVNAKNSYGASAMSEAALLGDAKLLTLLLKAGADPESMNADGQTALMVVARSNNLAAAEALLKAGADVNAMEQWRGQNAVIWAAGQSQPEMLQLLLKAGGDPNSRAFVNERTRQISAERRFQWRPAGGITALIYAAREGCVECVKLLVEAGAELDQGDAENVTPLLAAVINMHFDTAKYLVEAGANVNKWSFRGENPIYSAVDVNTVPHGGYPDRPTTDATSSLDMIRILLEAGANPNLQLKLQPTYRHIKDDRGADGMLGIGATPLLRAAKAHDMPAMELLLAHGALPNLPNRNGTTPLMAAAGLGANSIDTRGDYTTPLAGQLSQQAMAVLLKNGAELNAIDSNGRTALHGAAGWGWNEAVSFLIEQGADIKLADRNGLTAMDVALGKTAGSAAGRGTSGNVHKDTAELLQ